jgi:hypothetical protein
MVEKYSPRDISDRINAKLALTCHRGAMAFTQRPWIGVFFAFLISVYSVSLLPRISNGFLKLLFSTPPFTVEPNRVFYHYVVLTLIWLWVG